MITTKTGAKKIEGTDNWREIFDAHNDSVDAHDKISDAMTYVVNGNKSIESVSIPVGHYFRLANSSIAGRSDGLYTAKIAIPVDTVIDATYFNEAAPITGGVANALNSNIETRFGRTRQLSITIPSGSVSGDASVNFTDANNYRWFATIQATSSSSAYTGIFVEYVLATSTGVTVSVNRSARNNTSNSLTIVVYIFGIPNV